MKDQNISEFFLHSWQCRGFNENKKGSSGFQKFNNKVAMTLLEVLTWDDLYFKVTSFYRQTVLHKAGFAKNVVSHRRHPLFTNERISYNLGNGKLDSTL